MSVCRDLLFLVFCLLVERSFIDVQLFSLLYCCMFHSNLLQLSSIVCGLELGQKMIDCDIFGVFCPQFFSLQLFIFSYLFFSILSSHKPARTSGFIVSSEQFSVEFDHRAVFILLFTHPFLYDDQLWLRKVNPLVAMVAAFFQNPTFSFSTPHNLLCREGKYWSVLRFFSKFCQIFAISVLVALSVSCYLSYDGSVGSASAYQSVDSGFESRLRLIFVDKAEDIPVLSGRFVKYGA